jgi:hypothetical protein
VPPCQTRNLQMTIGGKDSAGRSIQYIDLRNTSADACSLSGYPKVVGTGAGVHPRSATHGEWFDQTHASTNLAPGRSAWFGLLTPLAICGRYDGGETAPGPLYSRLAVTLPASGNLTIDLRKTKTGGVGNACGLMVTDFGENSR